MFLLIVFFLCESCNIEVGRLVWGSGAGSGSGVCCGQGLGAIEEKTHIFKQKKKETKEKHIV